jgi:valyl-tRNA synthetase
LLPADRALLSWLQRLIARATIGFQSYEYAAALEATERFFWNTLCDNYLEWAKGRLYDGTPAERHAAQTALAHTLLAVLKLFAPILPHITEEIHALLFGDAASIHTAAWPQPDESLVDPAAERTGDALLAIAAETRRFKSARKLGLGATLARMTIALADADLRAALEQSATDLRSLTRARELAFAAEAGEDFEEAAPGLWVRLEI